jgi:hypothetical protein
MIMRTTLVAAVALAVIPVSAQASEPQRIDRDGYRIEYQVSEQADGSKLISGRELHRGETFSLLVRNRRVRGEVGGRYVSFAAPRKKLAVLAGN